MRNHPSPGVGGGGGGGGGGSCLIANPISIDGANKHILVYTCTCYR